MKRALTILVAVLTVTAVLPAAGLASAQDGDDQPGARFAGVVGVQGAEVEGELAERSLEKRLNRSTSNSSKAAVVVEEADRIEAKLDELEARRENVTEAYENGELTKAQYQAKLASIAAASEALERLANTTSAAAAELPEEALRERGANVSEVRALADRASELGGGEVAEAARNIAGEGAGEGLDDEDDRPGKSGDRGDAPTDQPTEREAAEGTPTERDDGESAGDDAGDAGNTTATETEGSDYGGTDTGSDGGGNAGGDAGNDATDAQDGSTTETERGGA